MSILWLQRSLAGAKNHDPWRPRPLVGRIQQIRPAFLATRRGEVRELVSTEAGTAWCAEAHLNSALSTTNKRNEVIGKSIACFDRQVVRNVD